MPNKISAAIGISHTITLNTEALEKINEMRLVEADKHVDIVVDIIDSSGKKLSRLELNL